MHPIPNPRSVILPPVVRRIAGRENPRALPRFYEYSRPICGTRKATVKESKRQVNNWDNGAFPGRPSVPPGVEPRQRHAKLVGSATVLGAWSQTIPCRSNPHRHLPPSCIVSRFMGSYGSPWAHAGPRPKRTYRLQKGNPDARPNPRARPCPAQGPSPRLRTTPIRRSGPAAPYGWAMPGREPCFAASLAPTPAPHRPGHTRTRVRRGRPRPLQRATRSG